jgi:hypothetical protein
VDPKLQADYPARKERLRRHLVGRLPKLSEYFRRINFVSSLRLVVVSVDSLVTFSRMSFSQRIIFDQANLLDFDPI